MYKTMLSHCLKCRKNTESQNSEVLKTKNGRIMQCVIGKKHFSKNKKLVVIK